MSFTQLAERLKENKLKFNVIDIETKPLKSWHWGLWRQNIGINQIIEHGGLLCFAVKTIGDDETQFYSEWDLGTDKLIREAYRVVEETDVMITYNGERFDAKKLNSYFVEHGLPKPPPYKHVDLYKENKKNFSFPSGKLDYMAQRIVDDAKTPHTGFDLWLGCMAGDSEAQALMERYNRQDVLLTERLYLENLSWWHYQPHMSTFLEGREICPKCGADAMQELKAGVVRTALQEYQLYQCTECKSYARSDTKLKDPARYRRALS